MFNLFDGCGAVSVEFAKRVADALELDYIPSAFVSGVPMLKEWYSLWTSNNMPGN